ncbi:MAG: DUF86 domain-containing protein [Desulfurococcus sp.]|nr:DUF86 domain-containing protein [Desulfurococcus sp.]
MTGVDREFVEKTIREIEEGLSEIRSSVALDMESFMRDKSRRFTARYSIILIVEAAADLGIAILRQCFNEKAESYREVFVKLAEKGVLSYNTARGMSLLASLRNMIVHRYWGIDDARIYSEAKSSGIKAVESFIREVEEYVSKDP